MGNGAHDPGKIVIGVGSAYIPQYKQQYPNMTFNVTYLGLANAAKQSATTGVDTDT